MASEKVETVIAGNYLEMEEEESDSKSARSKLSRLIWHGGSVYDAWFSCASNQVLLIHEASQKSIIFGGCTLTVCCNYCRLHKCYWHYHTPFHNLGWCLESFFSFSMDLWEAGLPTLLVFFMLSTEPERREKRLISGTM